MNTKTVSIKGMHCKSCEILIEDEIKQIKGVSSVDINHATGLATVNYEGNKLDQNSVKHAINAAGYQLGVNDKLPFFSRHSEEYVELGLGAVILILIYLIAQEFGLLSLNLGATSNFHSLPVVLLVGLTAGVSTCMALVGGLVLGVAGRFVQENPQATSLQKIVPHLFFPGGRLLSFFLLGGVMGIIGSIVQLSNFGMGILIVLVGVSMVYLGLQLIQIFPRIASTSITLPKWLSKSLGISIHQNSYSHKSAALLGALTFFVPCGFTQTIQLFAVSTGSFITGGITLLVFAIGTTPGLLSLGGLTSLIKGKSANLFFKIVGLTVIAMALFNISNGLTLAGIKIPGLIRGQIGKQISNQMNKTNVKMENGVQVLRMIQDKHGYSPNTFIVKKNIPVKWIIKSTYVSCANNLIVEKLNIRTLLTEKEQTFTFTPKEVGEIPFSCSMGMYSGTIIVK